MSKANSRFSTDTLRRLNEELNPTLERCILELGRNVYDVDATESIMQRWWKLACVGASICNQAMFDGSFC